MATFFQMIRADELKAIVKLVATALDQLRISYVIGGSVAPGPDFHADPAYM